MQRMIGKVWTVMRSKNWAIMACNAMALIMVIQNVNATCAFVDHQPEVPDEAQRFKKTYSKKV